MVPERTSLGLEVTVFLMRSVMTLSRSGAVMFWCRREDFESIGGVGVDDRGDSGYLVSTSWLVDV